MQASSFSKPVLDSRLAEDLLWRELHIPPFSRPVAALFLDRDGVIIEEREYIRDPDHVELLPGIVELIRVAHDLGMPVIQVSNQAGIAHGYSGWPEYIEVEKRMTELLRQQGARIDAVFACPFHPDGLAPYNATDHPWRKPNPGMLLEAARVLNLALHESVLLGDKPSDLEAARRAHLALGIHVLTGHGSRDQKLSRALQTGDFPVHVVNRADQAAPLLRSRRNLP